MNRQALDYPIKKTSSHFKMTNTNTASDCTQEDSLQLITTIFQVSRWKHNLEERLRLGIKKLKLLGLDQISFQHSLEIWMLAITRKVKLMSLRLIKKRSFQKRISPTRISAHSNSQNSLLKDTQASSKVKIKNFRSRFRFSMLRKIVGRPVVKAL